MSESDESQLSHMNHWVLEVWKFLTIKQQQQQKTHSKWSVETENESQHCPDATTVEIYIFSPWSAIIKDWPLAIKEVPNKQTKTRNISPWRCQVISVFVSRSTIHYGEQIFTSRRQRHASVKWCKHVHRHMVSHTHTYARTNEHLALCRAISLHCQLLAFTKQKHDFCHTLRHFLHPDPWPTLQILSVTHAAEIWAASKHWLRPPLLLHTNRQPTSTGGSASLPLSSGTWENAHWVHTVVSRRWDLLTSHFRHNVQLLHHRAPCCVAHWHLFHKLFWSSRRLWKFETCSSQYLFNCLSSLLLKVLTFISAVFTVLFNFCCTEVEQAP